jgi:2-dehydropantoate 2-reductase
MKILVVGAGAVGGYFGARLAQAGRDVTFLVRAGRAAELARDGLIVRSPRGDAVLKDVQTVQADRLERHYDLILLSCKAYDLDGAMTSFAPAVGPGTLILPMLNGMQHMDKLARRFGAEHLLGGVCLIASTLGLDRAVLHLNDMAAIAFGATAGGVPPEIEALAQVLRVDGFDITVSDDILQMMWEKWVFLATLAGSTCLFRGAIGDILHAPQGSASIERLWRECQAVAADNGHPARAAALERARHMLFAQGSALTASMLRDVENGAQTEADPILGDLLARAGQDTDVTLLRLAHTHLRTYQARRERESR